MADSKRGQEFTRLAKQISAASLSNPNPDQNPALREAIAKAKQANMPQSKIDNLLQQPSSASLPTATYEAFGPGGAALLIVASTDNPKRTVAELRHLLSQHGGTLGQPHAVLWKFNQSAPGQYTPQYQQTIAPDLQSQVVVLITSLLDHADVRSVFTDVVV